MKYDEIMVDIETLAARPNAAIVSIGACKFNWNDGVRDTFLVNIDAFTCRAVGLHIDKNSVDWWATQPKEARHMWQKNAIPLSDALDKFAEWYGNRNHPIWCNGTNFDIPILEEAYIRTGKQKPWHYWNVNDYRTVLNLFGLRNKDLRTNDGTMYHSALDDAIAQTEILVKLLRDYKNAPV